VEVYIRPIRSYITLGISSSQQNQQMSCNWVRTASISGLMVIWLIRAPRMGLDRLSVDELSCYFIAD
jgi:hypothetical protein